MTVKVGLIGAGRIGQIHAGNIARMAGPCRLRTVFDIDAQAARTCAEANGAEVLASAEAVVEDDGIDAVLICSATDTHAPLIEMAAAAGKHIFCEKPIALALQPIDRALAAVAKAGVLLQIGFNRRFDPTFAELRSSLAAGRIGQPHLLRITSRDPAPPPMEYVRRSGGLFLDMTIHDFDMALFLMAACRPDARVRDVFASGACRIDPAIGEAGDIDTAVVVLRFDDGTLATIDNSRRATYGYDQRIEVLGELGMLWADNRTAHAAGCADEEGLHSARPLDFFLQRYAESYVAELEAFVDAVQQDRESPVTGNESREAVVLALAAARSHASGLPVRLDARSHGAK